MKPVPHGFKYLLFTVLFAGTFRANAQVNFATYVNLSQQINAARKPRGEVMVHAEKGRFRIFVTFRNNQVQSIYAMDANGKQVAGTFSKLGQQCEVSFRSSIDGKLFSYDLACNLLPVKKQEAVPKK